MPIELKQLDLDNLEEDTLAAPTAHSMAPTAHSMVAEESHEGAAL